MNPSAHSLSPLARPQEPLHVGILCAGWRPDLGGVESHTADLAKGLLARGHRVSALCLNTSGAEEPLTWTESSWEGVDVRRVAYGWGDISKLMDLMAHGGLEAQLDEWLEAVQPLSLIHI